MNVPERECVIGVELPVGVAVAGVCAADRVRVREALGTTVRVGVATGDTVSVGDSEGGAPCAQ